MSLRKPLAYHTRLRNRSEVNNAFVEDGTYLKFRELAVKYRFSRGALENILGGFIKRVSLGVVGRNLITWTDYTGFDPEVKTGGEGVLVRFDSAGYPNFRTITGSIELEF